MIANVRECLRYATSFSPGSAPKGQDIVAQGNALGIRHEKRMKPCKSERKSPSTPNLYRLFRAGTILLAMFPGCSPGLFCCRAFGALRMRNDKLMNHSTGCDGRDNERTPRPSVQGFWQLVRELSSRRPLHLHRD